MKRAVILLAGPVLLCSSVPASGHAGAFILARCAPDAAGTVVLELTVDVSQHPVLKDRATALAALREVLRLESPAGPAALATLGKGQVSDPPLPDADLPVPTDPEEKARPHQLVRLAYTWQPPPGELRFSVPAANPHDVLFWLAGSAHLAGEPVAWRILIAGDQTPPVPIPENRTRTPQTPQMPTLLSRILLAIGIPGILASVVIWRARKK